MPVLTLQNVRKSIGARTLFADASLGIDEGEKVGVIGANGAGKSTLLRILAGIEKPDGGTVAVRRDATVGHLAQEPEFPPGVTIREAASAGRPGMVAALAEYDALAERLSSAAADDLDRLLSRQGELTARIEALGGWQWGHEVETILTRLGVHDHDRRVEGLSGGERKRVALARVLLDRPDLLLLDEPTNHLDADSTLWLEEHLGAYPGAVVLVTHDRYFLDRVVTRMFELEGGRVTAFVGGYTEYLEQRAARTARREAEAAKRDALIERELAWVKRSPAARTGKQKARVDRLEGLREERAAAPVDPDDLEIRFGAPPRLGRTVLDLENVTKSFGDRVLIRGFSTRIRAGERIGVVGPNGAGKTTLLRMIVGEVEPDAGEIRFGKNTRPVYFDQARSELDPTVTVYDSMGGREWLDVGGRRVHVRGYLDRFDFPSATHEQRVGSLSGGERNRLLIAKLLLEDANLLILDEPTNDLDLETLRALESALVEFGGSAIVVTHDRFFLDKVATGLLVFEDDGVVRRHEGGYELYRRLREEERSAEAGPSGSGRDRKPAAPERPARSDRRGPRRLSHREKQELAGMESAIVEAESRRDALGTELTNPSLYVDTPERVASLRAEFEEAERRVDELYARWAELEEIASADGAVASRPASDV